LHALSRELGPDQPFYGIEPEGMDGKRFQRPTVEQMADHYLAEIRQVQPSGPYNIGGYCFGGLVAFEMAKRLKQSGEEAALVVLFSAELRYNHRLSPERGTTQKKPIPASVRNVLGSPIRTTRNLLSAAVWAARTHTSRHVFPLAVNAGLRIPPSMRTSYVTQMLGRAERSYVPTPYPGTLVLLYGLDSEEFGPNLGWDYLATTLKHHVIGNDKGQSRRDIMTEPLVSQTARELAGYLVNGRSNRKGT